MGLARGNNKTVAKLARVALQRAEQSQPHCHFKLFGEFQIKRGLWQISGSDWSRPRASMLVRYQLINLHRAVTEDELLTALWPAKDSVAAKRSLQVTVSHARSVLDLPGTKKSKLQYQNGTYSLCLNSTDTIDTQLFAQKAQAALALRNPSAAVLWNAEQLWKGEPLPENRYSDWTVRWRTQLVDLYTQVLKELGDICLRDGNYQQLVEVANKLIVQDPSDEAVHRLLMLAYARSGRTGHALHQYLKCRHALIKEVGRQPDQATIALHAKLVAGETI